MRLLILTQKVDQNDDVLGFFHRWLLEFAKKCESVTVICLWRGAHSLPANVSVCSLGKESGASRAKYIWRLFHYVWRERKNYDAVFVHMNQIYVVLVGWLWRMSGKKIGLWYVHRQVSTSLKIAEKFVHVIFTAAKESCRIASTKIVILGHGIDTALFAEARAAHTASAADALREKKRIVTIGRITRIKNLDTFIEAAHILEQRGKVSGVLYEFEIVGAPISDDDRVYETELQKIISEKAVGSVRFSGSIPYKDIAQVYERSDLSVNLTPDGGLDKVVLESMAAGVPCITSNHAYKIHFGVHADTLLFRYKNAEDLAAKITGLLAPSFVAKLSNLRAELSNLVSEKFSLSTLVDTILNHLSSRHEHAR